MDTNINSGVDGEIESWALATTQTHVGNAALEALLLATFGSRNGIGVVGGRPFNTLDNVGHAAASVASENLDGLDMGLLCNTEFLACNRARAVSSVAVAIFVGIALRDGLAPGGAAFEVDVVDVGTGIDDIGSYTLTAIGRVEVLGSLLVRQDRQVRYDRQTLLKVEKVSPSR